MSPGGSSGDEVPSLARSALLATGAGVGVLALSVLLLAVLRPGPVLALVLALAGLVGCVAVLGWVAVRRARDAAGRDATDG